MTLTMAEIMAWVGGFVWVLIRVGAMTAAAPVLGSRSVPANVRVLVAVILSLAMLPGIESVPEVDPLSGEGVMLVAQQIIIGISMAFIFNMVMGTFVLAGEAIAMTMGLGFAQNVDPQNGVNIPLVSQFMSIVATLLFISLDGVAMLIKLLSDSFEIMPIAPVGMDREGFRQVALFAQTMWVNSVLLALPIVTALLMVNLAMGVITRASPQLNIFSVGFPATLMIGLFLIMVNSPNWHPKLEQFMLEGYRHVLTVLGA
ncbi:MAG: flagellar biosynthetic protein FliR [Halothiobacillaceae bacterium]